MAYSIAVLPGDGIGPEIAAEAVKLIEALSEFGFEARIETGLIGGAAVDATGDPLPPETIALCDAADAILLAAVGGPKYDRLPRAQRPETGLLRLRAQYGFFANLRPALLYPELAEASSLKAEKVAGLDLLIVRELTGGIYFGQPRGIFTGEDGERYAVNTQRYSESEIRRIVRVAFEAARRRGRRVCSVDKANVLEVSELWREVVEAVHADYPDVELSHMLVDNAAMQLVREPKQFDVVVTGNLFGDILSDIAAMLTGSIGMLPSASLRSDAKGLYEPVHGSAPDIAGQGVANPLATLLSVAMMLRHSFDREDLAARIERAVGRVLADGLRCRDIARPGETVVGTVEMGEAVRRALHEVD
ncbi:MAG: 3-isopropylmalate dehydrogenase [Gammaproteobacteria bacterium]|nr:MAG: 3-isopropylmalate dehydrogenase [Gammaproteobacteria bacterium]